MRIALTLEQLWHRVPGGVATVGHGLATALAARAEVEVVGVAARHGAPPSDPGLRPPVPVRHLPLPRPALYEAWQRLGRPLVERATGPVDVVHATTVIWPATRRPVVSTVHDLAFVDLPGLFPGRGRRLFEQGWKLALERAAVLVCVSEATRQACLARGVEASRLAVVHNGVDAQPATEVERAAARALLEETGSDRRRVVFLGTLEPRKNLRGLVAALDRPELADAELVLVGLRGWDPALEEALAPVRARTRVLGFLPVGLRRGVLAEAPVVAYPSVLEGFGLPVLEALAQGAPVVTSAGGATEEVAGGHAALADPNDPAALAGAVDAALRVARTQEAVAAAVAWAAGFTWERAAEGYLAAYRRAMG